MRNVEFLERKVQNLFDGKIMRRLCQTVSPYQKCGFTIKKTLNFCFVIDCTKTVHILSLIVFGDSMSLS